MKKLIIIFLLIMIIISTYQMINIYALYKSEISADGKLTLGTWNIQLNENDIKNGQFETAYIGIKNDYNDHTEEGTIAPGGEGYFEIQIDPSGTDVSIIYTIELNMEFENENTKPAIAIKSIENYYYDQQGEKVEDDTVESIIDNNIIKGIITLQAINNQYVNKVKVNVKWENDENNNDKDTELGKNQVGLIVRTNVEAKQYIGETLE